MSVRPPSKMHRRTDSMTAFAILVTLLFAAQALPPVGALLETPTLTDSTMRDSAFDQREWEGHRFMPALETTGGAVSAMSDEAAAVAIDVLQKGGNAIDAVVAAAFAEAVVSPHSCALGSDGVAVYRTSKGSVHALDFLGTASLRANASFVSATGLNEEALGHRTIAVPALVAGLAELHQRFGSDEFNWSELLGTNDGSNLKRAFGLAKHGFEVSREFEFLSSAFAERVSSFNETAKTFLVAGKAPYPEGTMLKQRQLAETLRKLEAGYGRSMYEGELASRIAADMEIAWQERDVSTIARLGYAAQNKTTNDAGLISFEDLASYRPIWREPISTKRHGFEVFTISGPTGGPTLIEALNILANFPLGKAQGAPLNGSTDGDWRMGSPNFHHTIAEAVRLAFADREVYIGDVEGVPLAMLLGKEYAKERASLIRWDRLHDNDTQPSSGDTCQISVIDRANNAVSMTITVGSPPWGSGVTVPGTGILLNNNAEGWGRNGNVTDGPNGIEGGKRWRVARTPAIVVHGNKPVLVLGGVGGPGIPTGVLQTILYFTDLGMDVAHAVDAPRLGAVGVAAVESTCDDLIGVRSGNLFIEASNRTARPGFATTRISVETQRDLEARGHKLCRHDNGPWNGFDDYGAFPHVRAVGYDRGSGTRVASYEPRQMDLRATPEYWMVGAAVEPS
jgi:gamma-glutamyltranspeptidase / glutathione hydrolase